MRFLMFTLSIVTLIGLTAWLWSVGWPQQQVRRSVDAYYRATAAAGFAVREILVTGRQATADDALLEILNIKRGAPIFAFDPVAALEAVRKLPWVADATIERRLPDTIYVSILERKPMARWQFGGNVKVIDNTGAVLPQADPAAFAALPLVVGKGADSEARGLFALLAQHAEIAPLVRSATRVSERRWNLQLGEGVTVRLPEYGTEQALARLTKLVKDRKIMARDIVAIDLRQKDRIAVETPGPVAPSGKGGTEPNI